MHWSEGECWDAYEAPSDGPLLSLLSESQPWRAVRYWLLDLAEELEAASKDQSFAGTLALDRVWVTAEGRAMLLDFPGPGVDGALGASAVTGIDRCKLL